MTPARHLEAARKRLQAAAVLLDNGFPEEASGRIYYPIYSAIRAALLAKGIRTGRRHQGNHHLFYEHIVRTGLVGDTIARVIGRAHFLRIRSDYAEEEANDVEARQLLAEAQQLVGKIEEVILLQARKNASPAARKNDALNPPRL